MPLETPPGKKGLLLTARYKRILRYLVPVFFLFFHSAAYAQTPVANFTANSASGCGPLVVIFQDQSTGNPKFWNWDLGNGQLSNLQNPTAVYSVPGKYTISLVVRNASGTNGITKTDYITVFPSPVASFTADNTIFNVSFSVGIADFPTLKETNELIDAADRALYQAKQSGRNQVVVFNAP